MGCVSDPAGTHRVGQEGDLLLLARSHPIRWTWWPWLTTRYSLPNCGLTKVILSSLKLLGWRYWRVHVGGVNSACLGLMSWGLTVLGALLLLLQPGDAGPCCCHCVLGRYKNMRTGENRCKRSKAWVQLEPEIMHSVCSFVSTFLGAGQSRFLEWFFCWKMLLCWHLKIL